MTGTAPGILAVAGRYAGRGAAFAAHQARTRAGEGARVTVPMARDFHLSKGC